MIFQKYVDFGRIYIEFKNGNYDLIDNLIEYEVNEQVLKIVVKNDDDTFFTDFYNTDCISRFQVIEHV